MSASVVREGAILRPQAPNLGFEYETWMDDALCAQTDPDLFFPEKGGSTRAAKKICYACPVQAQCLEYALRMNERYGIFGGLSDRERRRLQRGEAIRKPEFHKRAKSHGHPLGRPWNALEERTLMQLVGTVTYREIGERLGRTTSAVSQRYQKLKDIW